MTIETSLIVQARMRASLEQVVRTGRLGASPAPSRTGRPCS
jgi:hypothetical protein